MRAIHLAILICALSGGVVWGQESDTYVMRQVRLVPASASASSTNYVARTTVAFGPVGGASICNSGMRVGAPAAAIYPAAPVPVRLEARNLGGGLEPVELTWSGSATAFEVFRSTAPDAVASPINLLSTESGCLLVDPETVKETLLYYLVVPQ